MDSWDKESRRRVPRRQAPLTVRSPTPVLGEAGHKWPGRERWVADVIHFRTPIT